MKIKNAIPEYTGGGIYIIYGAFEDGNYFMIDACEYDVRILNADPYADYDESCYPEWQEEHLVKDLAPNDALEFSKTVVEWIKANKPNGNYDMYDMCRLIEDIHECEEIRARNEQWR